MSEDTKGMSVNQGENETLDFTELTDKNQCGKRLKDMSVGHAFFQPTKKFMTRFSKNVMHNFELLITTASRIQTGLSRGCR